MKTYTFNILMLLLAMVTIQLPLKAEQVKKIHKSWPVNKVTSLTVDNKFGNINFLNTRDDSVTIDVVVDTENEYHRDENSISNLIDFNFSFDDGEINAKTFINDRFKTNQQFTIRYTINIPIGKNLNITNRFGDVTLTDLKANGRFKISYGNIFGNSFEAPSDKMIELKLDYSNATIESINRLDAKIDYSKFKINRIEKAELETRYSTIFLDNCETLNSNSQYDNFDIGNLKILNTDSKFTDWKIDKLESDAEFTTEYGDVDVGHVSKNFKNIRIENRYGSIRIGIDKDATYTLNSDTYYCEVKHPKTSPTKYFKENNHTIIEAIIGNGKPLSKVYIESKYGKVDLME
jgi:hypothetical protein